MVPACFMLEREREREKEIKRERMLARVRTPSSPVREREYLFFKGMTGALAPFSSLVI
jgi:hypothetical protein